ncbi:MAG: radical SAM protein [Gemmatimonadetes bacterium]|nr:radical SAM protein [Gemmatimonadota bacterium]
MRVGEIYRSIQGESSWAGLPCTFVRLIGCNLRCSWCDSAFAFHGGESLAVEEVLRRVEDLGVRLVEVTGGEPLWQAGCLTVLRELCDRKYTVLLETGGSLDISRVDERVHRIVDLKAPGSGMERRNLWSNVGHLTPRDEVKFVLASRADYEWARSVIRKHRLEARTRVLLSTVFGSVEAREVVEWMLADGLQARFQIQLHKLVWDPAARGV